MNFDGLNRAGGDARAASGTLRLVDERKGPPACRKPEANGLLIAVVLTRPALHGVNAQTVICDGGTVRPFNVLPQSPGFTGQCAAPAKGAAPAR
ncbi:MAG: hypothetical protein ABJN26_15455 [Stappiaceae bacterium]